MVVVVVVCRVLGAGAGVILSQGRVGRATAVPVVDKVLVI